MNRVSFRRRLVYALVISVAVFGFIELGLRAAGFRFQRSLSYMRFNFPDPNTLHQIFEPDPDLLWRMRPSYQMGQGFPLTNQQGFRGPDFEPKKKPGTLRVICLGDSVTFGGPEASFPELLKQELEERLGRPIEVMNFGAPGYSSWQGRTLLARVLSEYRPDVVIILFGWNDHWLAKGFSDSEQVVKVSRAARWLDALRGLRVYQLMNRLGSELVGKNHQPLVLRVPPGSYRENLKEMVRLCRPAGALPVIVTSPSAIRAGSVPDFLVPLEFIREDADLERLHKEYNEIARETARDERAPLVDLDLAFQGEDINALFDRPDQDVIHPNPRGYKLIAELTADAITRERSSENR